MDKEKKTKTKKIISHGHGFFFITPIRQFNMLILTSIAVLMALAGAHVYLFYTVQSHDTLSTASTAVVDAPAVNQTKLQGVLDRFTAKQARRDEALTLVPPVSDPGI